jgi:hypothetical protein
MFNRCRQDIGEEELGADLAALDPNIRQAERSRSIETGQRVIGEFFFVHAAEAWPLIGPGEPEAGPGGRFSRPKHRGAATSSCTRPSANTLSRAA